MLLGGVEGRPPRESGLPRSLRRYQPDQVPRVRLNPRQNPERCPWRSLKGTGGRGTGQPGEGRTTSACGEGRSSPRRRKDDQGIRRKKAVIPANAGIHVSEGLRRTQEGRSDHPAPPGFTTEDAEDTEGLRMMSLAPRFARREGNVVVWGGRAPILPMPAARDWEPVVGAISPLRPPRSLR